MLGRLHRATEVEVTGGLPPDLGPKQLLQSMHGDAFSVIQVPLGQRPGHFLWGTGRNRAVDCGGKGESVLTVNRAWPRGQHW